MGEAEILLILYFCPYLLWRTLRKYKYEYEMDMLRDAFRDFFRELKKEVFG